MWKTRTCANGTSDAPRFKQIKREREREIYAQIHTRHRFHSHFQKESNNIDQGPAQAAIVDVVAVAEPSRRPSLVLSTAAKSGSRVVGQHHHLPRA
uniref:Uncharacterized protein n=1 Tax=Oryza barthii TaxID=65489 RepID=A0A679BAY3_9ORYZ|nr:hypothetical protein [Oryza barthii]